MARFFSRALAVLAVSAASAIAQQFYSTPYDLVRPVWPQKWDTTVFDLYEPGPRVRYMPKNKTPADFKPNEIIPDTLNQAYLDAMNLQMSPIRVNQAGYLPDDDQKLIYYVGSASSFDVVDLNNKVLASGTWSSAGASGKIGSSYTIVSNYSAERSYPMNVIYKAKGEGPYGDLLKGNLPAGLPENQRLRIKVGNDYSSTFIISENVYSMLRDAGLKFFGVNRSGKANSWFHPDAHTKDGMGKVVGGTGLTSTEGALEGGWYDCGDHLKESQTMSYAFMVLAVMSGANPTRDLDHYAFNQSDAVNIDGIPDMLREAKHGADFFLRSYDLANGVIDNMAVSVGNFGADHGWWGRPEYQDLLPATVTGRGGPHERDVRLGELGSNISGQIAAGLAILSVEYASRDKDFAAKCLKVSEEMYDFAKSLAQGKSTYGSGQSFVNNKTAAGWSSPAYNGNNEFNDDLALASVALLYATKDKKYLSDAVQDKAILPSMQFMSGAGAFDGGWFVTGDKGFLKNVKNTSWANSYSYALYALYKLIVETPQKATLYGIDETTRRGLLEDIAYSMIYNLGDMSYGQGTASIALPNKGVIGWKPTTIKYDPIWFTMNTDQTWIYNRYQAGNIVEVLMYAEVAKELEALSPALGGVTDWKSKDMRQLGINQLNYMLGLNPWDVSMVIGVGDKNDAHPHHRGANPEGKNVPGAAYKYKPPTGVIYGGMAPAQGANNLLPASASWEDYHLSEACIDAAATLFGSTTLASKDENIEAAPKVSVEIKYVGFDSAIVVVKQDMFGSATINMGTTETSLDQSFSSSTDGVVHTFTLKPLKNGTTYYFTATSYNARGGASTTKYLVDSTKTPYTFTTLNSPPGSADIQNVKVCNVSADSAEIMWYTPNGEYESKIYWDTVLTSYDKMKWSKSGDEAGVPTKFHYMKIGGLKEKTTYYYVVESNGQRKAVDDNGQPLKFTTPVTQYDFSVRTYSYEWNGMPAIGTNIFNNEGRAFDSLELRVYFNATEAQVSNCGMMLREDICQAYDEAGFNKPCEFDSDIRSNLRHAAPVKLGDTYNPNTNEYGWYFPINLGPTTIKSSSRLRLDMMFTRGIANNGICDELNTTPVKVPTVAAGDWSYRVHKKTDGDPVDYEGMPAEDKDFGDDQLAPINPYITVYRKDEFVSGYSPSYAEMITKRANYKLTMGLEAPFNVPDGSYVELDQGSSTVYAKGQAQVTEGGVITAIWVNGKKVEDLASAAVYNSVTDKFDLNIPVKMAIGANKIDITVFAGPSLDCVPCQENGGCAFVNRSFFVQFSKGNLTASSLRIANADGSPVTSPVDDPASTAFHIYVTDKDKAKSGTLYAYVINARKLDTLKVKLNETSTGSGEFKTADLIKGVGKDAASTSGNEIAFFGGDTLYVRYVDPDDEEDVSEQIVYAKPSYPMPQYALALDKDCDGRTDMLEVTFSNSFGPGDVFDSLWVRILHPTTQQGDSFRVAVPQPISGKNVIEVPIDRATIPVTGAPIGSVTAFLKAEGLSERSLETAPIRDGILPTLLGVALLENPEPRSAQDTLKISFSEPVSTASASEWPLALTTTDGTNVVATGITVVGKATTSDNGRSWLYVIEGNTDGLIVKDGYRATVKSGFTINDMSLNALDPVAGCNLWVDVKETPKPVPVTAASIIDSTGDGIADVVTMRFAKKLRAKDMLDSFVVEFGNPSVYRSYLPSSWAVSEAYQQKMTYIVDSTTTPGKKTIVDSTMVDDTVSVVTISIPADRQFPFGTTYGVQNGYGTVTPRLGPEGGFFDVSYSVADLCPPVIMSARKSVKMDSLVVTLSEPVLDTLTGGYYLERKRETDYFVPNQQSSLASGMQWLFFYDDKSQGYLRVGDFVRLPLGAQARFVDKSKNVAGVDNPWTEIKGGLSNGISFRVTATESVSDGVKCRTGSYDGFEPGEDDYFRISAMIPNTGSEVILASGGSRLSGVSRLATIDTSKYKHKGPTFQIEVQMPLATQKVAGENAWDFLVDLRLDMFNNMGNYVNSTSYNFLLSQLGRDLMDETGTIKFMLEWLAPNNGCAPLSEAGRAVASGVYIGSFDMSANGNYLIKGTSSDVGTTQIYKYGDRVKGSDLQRHLFGLRRTK